MAIATSPFTEKTEEQQAITEMVRQFVDNEVIPIAEEHDHEDKFPEAVVEQMKELGLFGVTIPEEYGGMGLDLTTYAMIVEELSRGWISVSGIVNTHFIGSYLLMKFGTRRAEGALPPEDGDRRDPRRLLALGARVRLGRPGHQGHRQEDGRRRLGAERPEDVGHERPALGGRVRAHEERPQGRPAPHRHDLLHHREGAGRRAQRRADRPAADQEDGLQGRRVDGARLRRLPLSARAHPRRRGGRARQGLRADDGRARGRPRERGRARGRHRPARARAGAALLAGAQDLWPPDREAPGDPVQARRHGDEDRGRPAADAARRRA